MKPVSIFLVLVIVLILLLCVMVVFLILFRDSIVFHCCKEIDHDHGRSQLQERLEAGGIRNLGFDNLEHPGLTPQRPFTVMEGVESPPTYEEAVKQELFRFRGPQLHRNRSNSLNVIPDTTGNPLSINPSPSTSQPDANQPSTSGQSIMTSSRSRSSTASSTNSTLIKQLSTIEEDEEQQQEDRRRSMDAQQQEDHRRSIDIQPEEDCRSIDALAQQLEDRPLTVVIDCIGLQTSRLMGGGSQDTVVLEGGTELGEQSKC